MITIITFVSILKTLGISLGVGASTVTITSFFAAILDGRIDETERRMLGVAYGILRVAMLVILTTTILLLFYHYQAQGLQSLPAYTLGELLVLFILFGNALLMTAHLVPTTIGPALQAGSWYTLGTLTALQAQSLTNFTFFQFLLAYITWLLLAFGIVNAIMAVINARKNPS